ncbi:hypothetical protein [Streptomyces sp. NPDC101234]|uniref:hypothetical protein n=1 Tax=Streptomyces sp. NPDC101234 TaxID=3366138 RepID=UPI0037F3556B
MGSSDCGIIRPATAPASPSPGDSPARPTAKSADFAGEFKDASTFRAFGLVLGGLLVQLAAAASWRNERRTAQPTG